MKFVCFGDDYSLGVLKGDSVVDLSEVTRDIPQVSAQDVVNQLIAGFDQYKGRIEEIMQRSAGIPVSHGTPTAAGAEAV